MNYRNRLLALVCLAVTGIGSACWAEGIHAITRPSKDFTLAFVRSGLVAEVAVQEGDQVKTKQRLARQDDREEQALLAQAKAQADDDVKVQAAIKDKEQKEADLRKIEWAADKRGATVFEVEHAKLDVEIAKLSLQLAKLEHSQDQKKYEQQQVRVDQMSIYSPVDGILETIFVKQGESAEQLAKVLRVVKIDPLWIEVAVPTPTARTLRTGDLAKVTLNEDRPANDRINADAKVIHIGSVADAASETLLVRVELPNPKNRPAGEHVHVEFPATPKVAER